MLFAFFTVFTIALVVQKKWWIKLLAPWHNKNGNVFLFRGLCSPENFYLYQKTKTIQVLIILSFLLLRWWWCLFAWYLYAFVSVWTKEFSSETIYNNTIIPTSTHTSPKPKAFLASYSRPPDHTLCVYSGSWAEGGRRGQ